MRKITRYDRLSGSYNDIVLIEIELSKNKHPLCAGLINRRNLSPDHYFDWKEIFVKIKNMRPGPLVIPDAKLVLAPDQVVETRQATRQIKSALDRGFVKAVNDNMPTGAPPKPKRPAVDVPIEVERFKPSEAIEYIGNEKNADKLRKLFKNNKDKAVQEALAKRLKELGARGRK